MGSTEILKHVWIHEYLTNWCVAVITSPSWWARAVIRCCAESTIFTLETSLSTACHNVRTCPTPIELLFTQRIELDCLCTDWSRAICSNVSSHETRTISCK